MITVSTNEKESGVLMFYLPIINLIMVRLYFVFAIVCLLGLSFNSSAIADSTAQFEQVDFRSLDGLMVTADLYETGDRSDPLVLLFHQTESSRGEYREIAPRLVELGFNTLAVDLRWGGKHEWFPAENETALRYGTVEIMNEIRIGNDERGWPTVLLSYEDMLAAYDWSSIEGFDGPKIVIGASMSSILTLRLPVDREIAAVFAFSPGEYGDDTTQVRRWCASNQVPTFIAGRESEAEISRLLLDAVDSPRKQYFQTTQDRHGSSILTIDEEGWKSFVEFLKPFKGSEAVSFQTEDGITIYGDYYATDKSTNKPMLLLFHQGGSNARAEYVPLASRLLAEGYHALAVDLRRGGARFGGTNRTIEHLDSDTEYSYCDSYPDLEATLRYVQYRGYNKNIIAWGSSFSATLVIQLAVEHSKELSGVLSFSTAAGLPMEGCNPDQFIENLQIPALFLRPPREIHHLHIIEQIEALDRLSLKSILQGTGFMVPQC